jgi:hypothetical protein
MRQPKVSVVAIDAVLFQHSAGLMVMVVTCTATVADAEGPH